MTIEEVTKYRCSLCKKEFNSHPGICNCINRNQPGKIIGPFTLLSKNNGSWKCQCNICSQTKNVHSSNIRRQNSCGCAPRWIEIIEVNKDKIRYKCRKCNQSIVSPLPVFEWCCGE